MSDSSMATEPTLDLIAGDCWAQRQLRRGIQDVFVAFKPMQSLTIMGVVYIATLAPPGLDIRFLHNRSADARSDCGRLLGKALASRWYKVHVSMTFIQTIRGLNEGLAIPELNRRSLHNRSPTPVSDCWRLLCSTPATQRYMAYHEMTIPHGAIGSQEGGWMEQGSPGSGWIRISLFIRTIEAFLN